MGEMLAKMAHSANTASARKSDWFNELVDGNGRASDVRPEVREALIAVTADIAREMARAHQLEAERRAAEQRKVAIEERRQSNQERWRLNRAIIREAFGTLFSRTIISALLVGLTPVAASFATVIPYLDNIEPVVFFPGETGSYAGSGPFTLYSILMWCVGSCLVAMFVSDLLFGSPNEKWSLRLSVPGVLLGLGLFIFQWFNNSLVWYSWTFAPLLYTMGYIWEGVISGSRMLRMRRGRRDRESG